MPILLGILGIGALILWAGTSSAGTSQQASRVSVWPPQPSDISSMTKELQGYLANTGTGDDPSTVGPAVVASVQPYQAYCAANGIAPTISGWQQYVRGLWSTALQATGVAPGYDPNLGPYGSGQNSYIDPQWPS